MSEQTGSATSWVEEARAVHTAGLRRRLLEKIPSFRPRELVALAIVAAFVIAGAGIAFVRALPKSAPPPVGAVAIAGSPSPSPSAGLVVHVAGAVRSPGVYELPAGSRVIDALKIAGGALRGADVDAMNLARPVADGERLWVPKKGEAPATGTGGGGDPGGAGAKVNINTASVSDLDGLPGVGPVLAQRIVDYRTQHGPFRDVRDLLKVEGIGDKKFASLKERVTV